MQGKHTSLPHSWMPSQAPNGWTSSCFPSCCNCNSTRACMWNRIYTCVHTYVFLHISALFLKILVFLLDQLWNVIKILVPEPYSHAFLGGGLLGYVIYDCTHYYLHHGKPTKGVSHQLKVNYLTKLIITSFWIAQSCFLLLSANGLL